MKTKVYDVNVKFFDGAMNYLNKLSKESGVKVSDVAAVLIAEGCVIAGSSRRNVQAALGEYYYMCSEFY